MSDRLHVGVRLRMWAQHYRGDGRQSGAHIRGASVVVASGCHCADCHYINANRWTEKRVDRLWDKLERKGIRPERLQLEWISAAEGAKFQTVMKGWSVSARR